MREVVVSHLETDSKRQPYSIGRVSEKKVSDSLRSAAMRTAFVARFIVLREGRRSRAHRIIEAMEWDDSATAEELFQRFREAFIANGDKLVPVDRDLKRAMEHARCSTNYFLEHYVGRMTLSFTEALVDYERTNRLLFGDDPGEVPRTGGWRLPSDHISET